MGTPTGSFDSLDALTQAATPTDDTTSNTGEQAPQPPSPVSVATISTPPLAQLVEGGELYVTLDDVLQVLLINSNPNAQVIVTWRLLRIDGTITMGQEILTPTHDRHDNYFRFNLAEGFLLSLTVANYLINLRHGECFASITVVRNSPQNVFGALTLVQDYVVADAAPGWPNGILHSPTEGPGYSRSILGTMPLVGAEILEVMPYGSRRVMRSLRLNLQTSAAVGNRQAKVFIDDGVNVLSGSVANYQQTAGMTVNYSVGPHSIMSGLILDTVFMPMEPQVPMMAGWRIRTQTAGLLAGDQWSAPQYAVEEWIEQ